MNPHPGIDCLLAAARVGERGRAIGVDMAPEMLSSNPSPNLISELALALALALALVLGLTVALALALTLAFTLTRSQRC